MFVRPALSQIQAGADELPGAPPETCPDLADTGTVMVLLAGVERCSVVPLEQRKGSVPLAQ